MIGSKILVTKINGAPYNNHGTIIRETELTIEVNIQGLLFPQVLYKDRPRIDKWRVI